jgi:uroporphyrinogen decarboxylase
MNARERVRTALTCGTPDRIPKTLGFFPQAFPDIAPTAPEDYFKLDVRFAEFKPPRRQKDFQQYLDSLPSGVHMGNRSQLQTYFEWDYHPERGDGRPLSDVNSVSDLIEYTLPDLADPSRYADLRHRVANWHAQGLAVAGAPPHLGGELFEAAWRLRGFNTFLIDLFKRRSLSDYLLDQLTAMTVHSVLILARSGVDILLLDDDVAMPDRMIISPRTWQEHFKGRLAEVIRAAREASPDILVFYHSDGNFSAIVPELVEIGVNVINPLQPDCMDAAAIKNAFGDQLALWGTVGTAWQWDFGTTADIRAQVKHSIDTLGPAGLLLSPAYDLDFTPFDNIAAFVEAANEFGKA